MFDPGCEELVEFNTEQLTTRDLNFLSNIVQRSEPSGCCARLEEKTTLLRRLAADADVRVAARKSQSQNELKAAQAGHLVKPPKRWSLQNDLEIVKETWIRMLNCSDEIIPKFF